MFPHISQLFFNSSGIQKERKSSLRPLKKYDKIILTVNPLFHGSISP